MIVIQCLNGHYFNNSPYQIIVIFLAYLYENGLHLLIKQFTNNSQLYYNYLDSADRDNYKSSEIIL